jgi:hypothetical protein
VSAFVPYEFIPNLQYIANITNAQQAVVTFAEDHNFFVGEWISFRVPNANGMIQLNNQKGLINAITPTTVTIDVDTLQFYPFISAEDPQVPCVAVGAGSGIPPGASYTTLEDAFDNVPLL